MGSKSKYITDEQIQEAKDQLAGLVEEDAEIALLEKAGNDVTQLRQDASNAKSRLKKFIETYDDGKKTR